MWRIKSDYTELPRRCSSFVCVNLLGALLGEMLQCCHWFHICHLQSLMSRHTSTNLTGELVMSLSFKIQLSNCISTYVQLVFLKIHFHIETVSNYLNFDLTSIHEFHLKGEAFVDSSCGCIISRPAGKGITPFTQTIRWDSGCLIWQEWLIVSVWYSLIQTDLVVLVQDKTLVERSLWSGPQYCLKGKPKWLRGPVEDETTKVSLRVTVSPLITESLSGHEALSVVTAFKCPHYRWF